jgi:hypothetical protein
MSSNKYRTVSYRPARLHRLAELIPWNQFLDTLNVSNSSSGFGPVKVGFGSPISVKSSWSPPWLGGLEPTSLVLGFCTPFSTGWQGYFHIFHRVTRDLCLFLHDRVLWNYLSIVRKNLWKYFTEYNNTFWNWLSDSLTTRLDLIHARLDLINTSLDLIQNSAGSHQHSARSHSRSARSHPRSAKSHLH